MALSLWSGFARRWLGLPVPRQEIVHSARSAVQRAERIGYPVVLKPLNGNHGRGVSIAVEDAPGVEKAFEEARKHSRSVLVESYVSGFDHRLLVIDDGKFRLGRADMAFHSGDIPEPDDFSGRP